MWSSNKYSLEIVSHHAQFKNRSLKKYNVNGVETVGAWGDEPFEVRFRNNTGQKLQVKVSIDGTDILTGDLADTQVSKDMWVVAPYGVLNLKAWPETSKGGAAFVFTSASNSVANHIHGDLSNRGIIAVAVFTEGHVEPQRINYSFDNVRLNDARKGGGTKRRESSMWKSVPTSFSSKGFSEGVLSFNAPVASSGEVTIGELSVDNDLESLVAVGAGDQVEQKITYVEGLIKPIFSEIVKVKYMWWDELKEILRGDKPKQTQDGFPGDKKAILDLGSTPRVKTNPQTWLTYSRV
jgi:hypothetical protein